MRMSRLVFAVAVVASGFAFPSVRAQEAAELKQQLYLFSQALPAGSKIGVLCQMASHQQDLQALLLSGKAYKLEVFFFDVKTVMDLEKGMSTLVGTKGINAVLLLKDAVAGSKSGVQFLAGRCKGARIPLLAVEPGKVQEGATASVIKGETGLMLYVNRVRAQETNFRVGAELQAKTKYVE